MWSYVINEQDWLLAKSMYDFHPYRRYYGPRFSDQGKPFYPADDQL